MFEKISAHCLAVTVAVMLIVAAFVVAIGFVAVGVHVGLPPYITGPIVGVALIGAVARIFVALAEWGERR